MGLKLENFKKKIVKAAIFDGEKSLDIGKGFIPCAAQPVTK